MRARRPAGRTSSVVTHLAGSLALLAALAGPARAESPGALLELTWGPSQVRQATLVALRAELDGRPLVVEQPGPGQAPVLKVYAAPLAAGPHRLHVIVTLAGDFPVFSYLQDYRLDLAGTLDFASAAEGVVEVTALVKSRSDLGLEWQEKNALELSAVRRVPLPGPQPEAADEPPPSPAPAALAVPVGDCALEPILFGVESAELTRQARAALDRFAACLAPTRYLVRLVGHSDSSGGDALNQKLGLERSRAAEAHLRQRGIPAGRITATSMSDDRTLCSEWTPACDARNRRVEAVVLAP
jgi:outer membrane protein OmpA-like peptidoglycan-associated protein